MILTRGLFLAALALSGPVTAQQIDLAPPLDCSSEAACFVQQYVDTDPGPGAVDFACGPLTYDGHKGTDFALPSLAAMEAGRDVRASAAGTVTATRDGLPDIASDDPDAVPLDGRDCGNGVVLDHGDGWETQYCHLKRGSIAVAQGDAIETGDVLGQVGLSGRTTFPHVHLSVRRDGAVVDPFDPDGRAPCGDPAPHALWGDALPYVPGGLVATGFADAVPDYAVIKAGDAALVKADGDTPALVVWTYAFGARAGDTLALTIEGPDGEIVDERVKIERTQAQLFRAVGRRRPDGGWTVGTYTATARHLRDGTTLATQRATLDLR